MRKVRTERKWRERKGEKGSERGREGGSEEGDGGGRRQRAVGRTLGNESQSRFLTVVSASELIFQERPPGRADP